MKSLKILLTVLAVLAAIVFAAKTPVVFAPGLEGFAKPAVTPEVTQLGDYVVVDFGDQLGEKGTLQFTKFDGQNIVVKAGNVKSIGQKGKALGNLAAIIADDPDLQIKMKGVVVGTVVAAGLKSAQVSAIYSVLNAGSFAKGTTVKASSSLGGTLDGCFKSLACGWFEDTYAPYITTPKCLNLKAKTNLGGKVYVPAGLAYKAKNVDVVPAD